MTTASKGPDPNIGVRKALNHMKQAEAELLAVVRMESHSKNALLLEAHAFLWEAISTLSKAASSLDKR